MSNTQRPDSARGAIELMTAWLGCPDGRPDLLIACLRHRLEDRPDGDKLAGAVELVMGQTYLCGSLLLLLQHETGVSPHETLQALALEYAQD